MTAVVIGIVCFVVGGALGFLSAAVTCAAGRADQHAEQLARIELLESHLRKMRHRAPYQNPGIQGEGGCR